MFDVQHLSFTYPKQQQKTIQDISFSIKKGEIFGFLGPSGAGKSTTQKLLLKLLTGHEGKILYQGQPIESLGTSFYESIGVSFEMPIHFTKMTALENMEFFSGLYTKKGNIESLLKQVGLWEDRDKLVSEFSKGMKIRLNIVRALLNQPDMLFLDEPTNGLDPKNAKILKDMILDFKAKGGTVFITSHIMSDIEYLCDRVAFIVEGSLIEMDTPKALKLKYGKKIITLTYHDQQTIKEKVYDLNQPDVISELTKDLQTYPIETLHSGETTLEDIFIHVTGKALREHDV